MRIDKEQMTNVIDHIINAETEKHMDKELAHFETIGQPIPRPIEMPLYVAACRERVQTHLEACN